MGAQAALSTPEDEVSALVAQVAEEHGLELAQGLPSAAASRPAAAKEDDLTARLAELRGR